MGILIAMVSTSRLHQRRTIAAMFLSGIIGALVLLVGGAPVAPVARAADLISDIPGIPLPGPVAAGRLGGAIYDVVYRLSVAPGHVIVASLTGTAGTDFDLYLFDSTATTVVSNVGLLTKSTGNTTTESISWPSRAGGIYYIDLNGATDVEGDYRLTVQDVPDATPPTVSMALAGGRPSTNQANVPVTLTAIDDLSGVSEMALSTDGVSYSAWQAFQHSTTWPLPAGDGLRSLWAKVRNGVGLESVPATASVTVDTVPPLVIGLDPAPGTSFGGLRPHFAAAFNEPMDPETWNNLGLIVQSATGALVLGAYAYDAATRAGTFVPAADLQAGVSYVVTFGDVDDLAGNRVPQPASWSITPLAITSLAAKADAKVLPRGGSAEIGVVLTGAPLPATVQVLSAQSPADFVPLTVLPAETGRTTLSVAPASNTTYRFRYVGAFGVTPAQVDVPVLVRRSVALVARSSTVVSRSKVGAPVSIVAAVGPASAGVSVSFRMYRFDTRRRTWIYAGSRGRSTNVTGRASYTWIPPTTGSYYWRASVASTVEFANNISPVYRWSITR